MINIFRWSKINRCKTFKFFYHILFKLFLFILLTNITNKFRLTILNFPIFLLACDGYGWNDRRHSLIRPHLTRLHMSAAFPRARLNAHRWRQHPPSFRRHLVCSTFHNRWFPLHFPGGYRAWDSRGNRQEYLASAAVFIHFRCYFYLFSRGDRKQPTQIDNLGE